MHSSKRRALSGIVTSNALGSGCAGVFNQSNPYFSVIAVITKGLSGNLQASRGSG